MLRSNHNLISLNDATVVTPELALELLLGAYEHELWGPETLRTRSETLRALQGARYRFLMAYCHPDLWPTRSPKDYER